MKNRDYLREARTFTVKQLTGKIDEGKRKLIDLDQQKLLGKLKNFGEIKTLRRQIAQLMTIRDEQLTADIRTQEGKDA